jgi:cation diffusion facilitator family transporter
MNQRAFHKKATNTAWMSLVTNLLFALSKSIVGFFGNSYALIADAIESVGDVFASALVLVGFHYTKRPPDENHPYGHGKAEPLITFAVVGLLVASAVIIVLQSIENIQTPHKAPETYTLWFLGIIILAKELSFRFVNKRSNETKSTSLKADAWHHRSDAITSICAFVGISIAVYKGDDWAQADDWAAMIAALFILYNAYHIFRPALGEIMDEHVYDDFILLIRDEAKQIPEIIQTEKCFIRKSGMRFWVDIHIQVDSELTVFNGHEIAHRYKDLLIKKHPEIENVLVHVEPAESTSNTV